MNWEAKDTEHSGRYTKNRVLKKHFWRDIELQFSALRITFWQNYLGKLPIGDKYLNKRVALFTNQTMCIAKQGENIIKSTIFY